MGWLFHPIELDGSVFSLQSSKVPPFCAKTVTVSQQYLGSDPVFLKSSELGQHVTELPPLRQGLLLSENVVKCGARPQQSVSMWAARGGRRGLREPYPAGCRGSV